jgi:cytochrome c oxidase subunit II
LRGHLHHALRRPRTLAVLALVTLPGLGLAPSAFASALAPEKGGSPAANHIWSLYVITLIIATVIFIGVEGTILYCLVRFRARKGREAKQIHGNARLEVGWTVGAALVLVALAVVTFLDLREIRNPVNSGPGGLNLSGSEYVTTGSLKPPNGRALTIDVVGMQFIWQYVYKDYSPSPTGLGTPYSYYQMVVPTNTTVILHVSSKDVVHEWWIPKLGAKVQAVPGYTNETWFKISKPGNYPGQCSFICGRGHTRMIAEVTAVPPAQFLRWIHTQELDLRQADLHAEACRQALSSQLGAQSIQTTKAC